MLYRKLGRTDLNLSEISIGCSGYWGNVNYSEREANMIVNIAFDRGVNFFDTGHNYSNFNAEPRLGRIVKDLISINGRSNIIISTKGGSIIGSAPILPFSPIISQNFSPNAIERSCQNSIKNLNCEFLDIFQLHGISESQFTDELLGRLLNMKRKGMFRYLGINTHTTADILFVSKHPEIFDMILIDYNVLQLDREKLISTLDQAGVGVVAGTVLAQGHLIKGKIGSIRTGSFFWYLARTILKPSSRKMAQASKYMRNVLSLISEMSPAQAAFAFILENKKISSCVFGTTNLNNCLEIIDSSGMKLSEGNITRIRECFTSSVPIISA